MSQNKKLQLSSLPSTSPLIAKLNFRENVLKRLLILMRRPVVELMEEKLNELVNLIAEIPAHQVQLTKEWNNKVTDFWRQYALLGGNAGREDVSLAQQALSTNGEDYSSDQNGSTNVTEGSPKLMKNKSGNCNNNHSRQLHQAPKPLATIRERKCTICESNNRQKSNRQQNVAIKRRNSTSTAVRKFPCKYANCSKSFDTDYVLRHHEHLHLGIKPYSCGWPDCAIQYRSIARRRTVEHIRAVHLGLTTRPVREQNESVVEQQKKNPLDYLVVDMDKLHKRLI